MFKQVRTWLGQIGSDVRESTDASLLSSLRFFGLLYGPIVAGFAVVSVYCYSKHHLDRRRHREIVAELASRRGAGATDASRAAG